MPNKLAAEIIEALDKSARLHHWPERGLVKAQDAEIVNQLLVGFVERVESAHFRTNEDTGANPCARLVWNILRQEVGLPYLEEKDLPAYCIVHKKYHKIEPGCQRFGGSKVS